MRLKSLMKYAPNVTRIVEFIATGRPMPFANSRSSLHSSKSRIQGVLCRIPSLDRFLSVLNIFFRSTEESTSLKLWRIKGNSEWKARGSWRSRSYLDNRNFAIILVFCVKKRDFRQRLGTLRTIKLYNALVLNIYIYYFRDISKYFSIIICCFTFMNIIRLCAILGKYICLIFQN